jgi:hypothetical protein
MKKIILSLTFISLLGSCKEKLPSNLQSTLFMVNTYAQDMNSIDSVIIGLTDTDINKLSSDSAFSLYARHTNSHSTYEKYQEELDELLKYNAKYSDYDEVKNQTYHFTVQNRIPYDNGRGKINLIVDKLYDHYYSNKK